MRRRKPWGKLTFKAGRRISEQSVVITGSMKAKKWCKEAKGGNILRVDDFTVKQWELF